MPTPAAIKSAMTMPPITGAANCNPATTFRFLFLDRRMLGLLRPMAADPPWSVFRFWPTRRFAALRAAFTNEINRAYLGREDCQQPSTLPRRLFLRIAWLDRRRIWEWRSFAGYIDHSLAWFCGGDQFSYTPQANRLWRN